MTIIKVIDHLEPEVSAMLQAFYSRSHTSIDFRLNEMYADTNDIKKQLNKYYVGYGHSSIADCGFTTIFIEGVSLLAAKVFQDTPLYNGQESSTRYINFSTQPLIKINDDINKIQNEFLNFYTTSFNDVYDHLYEKYLQNTTLVNETYTKTIRAKSFDILRGFLPAGVTTQLSWVTSLRHAKERLILLANHPLQEVQEISKNIIDELIIKYPDTFSNIYELLHSQKEYISSNYDLLFYFDPDEEDALKFKDYDFDISENNNYKIIEKVKRDKHNVIPRMLNMYPDAFLEFKLCFASARDLLRHRNCFIPLPLLTTNFGFNDWYIENLPEKLQYEAKELISNIPKYENSYEFQYALPIGFNVPIIMKASLPQLIYIIELRSSKTVHPTLRKIIHKIAKSVEFHYPDSCDFYCDYDEDDFDIKRGSQDIVLK